MQSVARNRIRIGVLFAFVLLITGCGGGTSAGDGGETAADTTATTKPGSTPTSPPSPTDTPAPTPTLTSTPSPAAGTSASGLIEHCNTDGVTGFVERFLEVFNRGDQDALKGFFPEESSNFNETGVETGGSEVFQVYLVKPPDELANGADNRGDLLAYFAERHSQDEHLELQRLEVEMSGRDASIRYILTREASDVPEHEVMGEAVINCEHEWISSWRMGAVPEGVDNPLGSPESTPTAMP